MLDTPPEVSMVDKMRYVAPAMAVHASVISAGTAPIPVDAKIKAVSNPPATSHSVPTTPRLISRSNLSHSSALDTVG